MIFDLSNHKTVKVVNHQKSRRRRQRDSSESSQNKNDAKIPFDLNPEIFAEANRRRRNCSGEKGTFTKERKTRQAH